MGGSLPGESTVAGVLWAASLLLLPLLLAAFSRRFAVYSIVSSRSPMVPPRALLRLSMFATPLALHGLFEFGAYNDCIDRLAPSSHTLRVLLALAPLYLAELPRSAMATMAEGLLEARDDARGSHPVSRSLLPGWRDIWPAFRLRLGWPILALLPAVLLGGCLDLLQLHRETYVLVFVTSGGMTLATLAFLVLAAVVLPFWFRVAFGVKKTMPEPIGTTLRATAQLMGFSPRRVFVLPTGMRSINAMMVGPLPVGRLLCLTDGLLSMLDSRSLTGVLAHEIGHARMGHPGLLMLLAVIVPLMLLSPLRLLDVEEIDVTLQAVTMLGIMLLGWFSLRTLARRFEHEADVSSVQALGAEPCSRALLTVSSMTIPQARSLRGRLLSLHPDERERLAVMRSYEVDPAFREQFDRQTRRLRRVIAAVLLGAVAFGGWFWQADWQYERVLSRFYSGDLVGAQQAMSELKELPPRWQGALEHIDEELVAGLQLAPDARDWPAIEKQLLPAAWQRGERVLLAEGPAAARPWFSLAVYAMPTPTAVEYAIYEYCRAAADADPERTGQLARIIKRLGAPPSLEVVFRDY
tara:strand:- start:42732 stop:44468 length:1737 start_codon:yes stop_codon:yes gene_type:complete